MFEQKRIADYTVNDPFSGFAILKSLLEKESRGNGPYLHMVLGDVSGTIDAKKWGTPLTSLLPGVEAGKVVFVEGTVSEYRDRKQVIVESIRPASPMDTYDEAALYSSAPIDGLTMYNELVGLVNTFRNEEYKRLVLAVYEKYRTELLYYAAGMTVHHNDKAGLLFHVYQMVRSALALSYVYYGRIGTMNMNFMVTGLNGLEREENEAFDPELLVTGVMLHDIGKIPEFISDGNGIVTDYSVAGNLIGHTVLGCDIVTEVGKEIGISDQTLMLIKHLLLSHMALVPEAAANKPMMVEAELLARLDDLDSRVYIFKRELSALEPDTLSSENVRHLYGRRVYRHQCAENV